MRHTNLWLDISSDRYGLEVVINGVPALRLGQTAGLNAPINEYVLSGVNTLLVRLSPWAKLEDGPPTSDVKVTLTAATFEDATHLASRPIGVQAVSDAPVAPAPLLRMSFTYDQGGLPDPSLFAPVTPPDVAAVQSALADAAAAWRAGDAERLADMLDFYFADYGRAYPAEGASSMRARFIRMAKDFAGQPHTVEYDVASVRIEPCAGGRLLDAYGASGAPIRVLRPGAPPYDFWAIFGMRGHKAVIVR